MSKLKRRTWRAGLVIAACHLAGFYWFCGAGDDDVSDPRQPVARMSPAVDGHAPTPTPTPTLTANAGAAPASGQPIRLISATVEKIASDAIGGFSGRVIDWGTGLGVAGRPLPTPN